MKKLIGIIALAAVGLTAVPAEARGGHHGGYRESNYRPPYYPYNRDWNPPRRGDYDHRRRHDRDAADVLVPLIGGAIIGAIIAGSQNQERQPDPREYRYDSRCDCYRR